MSKNYPLHIKNMVCPRCIKAVREEAEGLGLEIDSIKLGEVVFRSRPDEKRIGSHMVERMGDPYPRLHETAAFKPGLSYRAGFIFCGGNHG